MQSTSPQSLKENLSALSVKLLKISVTIYKEHYDFIAPCKVLKLLHHTSEK